MDPEIDNITRARDLWRQNPKITASELKDALGLGTAKVAQEILKEAMRKEVELKDKLAAEDAAGVQAQESDQVPYLRDPESGMSHKLQIVGETKRAVVFEFEKPGVKLVRG